MELQLKRETPDQEKMFGVMYVDEIYECETLEDPPRSVKIPGNDSDPDRKVSSNP